MGKHMHDASTIVDHVLGKSYEVATCAGCRTLGPSNDAPAEVQIEMRAAEIDAWCTVDNLPIYEQCTEHEIDGWSMWCGGGDLIGFPLDPAFDQLRSGVLAGWLACESSLHDERDSRDGIAWPWDPSRPVAGQYEELLVEVGVAIGEETEHGIEVPIEQEHTCMDRLECARCDSEDDEDRDTRDDREIEALVQGAAP